MSIGKERKSKILIFDFDGTIVDSKQVYYHAMNKHLEDYGFTRKEIDKAIDVGLSVAETLKKLKLGKIFSWFLKRRIMKDVLINASKIKKCKDVDSIKNIKNRKILISNSLQEFVFPIIKHLKLKEEFDEIYTAENFDDKTKFIKNYVKRRKINKKNCYYIGDRATDAKLAGKVGIKSIIVVGKCAWDSRAEILNSKPDFVISDIREIRKLI